MSTTGAGAIDVLLRADTASFEASMSKAAASSEREMRRVERAQASAKAEGDRFLAGLQRQVDTFGLTGTKLQAYEAGLRGVSAQAAPLIAKLDEMKLKQQAANDEIKKIDSSAVKAAGHDMEQLGFHTVRAKRELLVMTHELSQGRYKNFGGSALVLAEETGVASLLFSGAGLAALGAAAGIGLFALAAAKGALESIALNKALALTGNFAGATAEQFTQMAKGIDASTGLGVGKARDALLALVSTGEIGPRVLAPMTEAVVRFAHASGETEEAVAKDFAKMSDGVAKWATEHNKQYNFLTLAQYDYIKKLEDQGKIEQAEIETLKLLTDHVKPLTENYGYLEGALHRVSDWAGRAFEAMKDVGRAAPESAIEAIDKQIADSRKHGGVAFTSASPMLSRGNIQALQEQRRLLAQEALRASNQALSRAEDERAQKAAIASRIALTALDEERKGATRLQKDLEKLHKYWDDLAKVGLPVSDADKAAQEADVRYRDRSVGEKAGESEAKRLANSIKERLNLYAEETAKLKAQEDEYAKYGKLLDKTAAAVAMVDITSGKYAKATASVKASVLAAAQAEDVQAEKTKAAHDAATRREEDAKKREANAVALKKLLDDEAISTEVQVQRLQEETKQLGLNNLERRVMLESLKIEGERRKQLADPKNAGHESEINDAAAARTRQITMALNEADTAARSFGTGSARAFASYGEAAANEAAYAEKAIGGSLTHIEDGLLAFEKTGKLTFGSLFGFMADEFLRGLNRMLIAQATAQGGWINSLGGALAGVFGAGGGIGSGTGAATGGAAGLVGTTGASYGSGGLFDSLSGLLPGLASGTDYVPYDGYMARLHQGEAVVPKAFNPAASGSGGGGDVHMSVSIDARGAEAGVEQRIQAGMQQVRQQVLADVQNQARRGGSFAQQIGKRA